MNNNHLEGFKVELFEITNQDLENLLEIKQKYIKCNHYSMAALTRDLEKKTREIIEHLNSKNEQSKESINVHS